VSVVFLFSNGRTNTQKNCPEIKCTFPLLNMEVNVQTEPEIKQLVHVFGVIRLETCKTTPNFTAYFMTEQ
jgi:hypothetical protein